MVLIPNTKHFFISLRDHPEYGAAHTVFGEVFSNSHIVVFTLYLRYCLPSPALTCCK